MVEVHISRKARKDLDIIKEYIAQDNPQRAESFSVELFNKQYKYNFRISTILPHIQRTQRNKALCI